jgi:hypothetical protein
MIIVFTLAAISVLAITFISGYRFGLNESCAWCKPTDPDDSTPIYDKLAQDDPISALKLIAPVEMEIAE